jgi:hypothetical protein
MQDLVIHMCSPAGLLCSVESAEDCPAMLDVYSEVMQVKEEEFSVDN